MIRMSIISGGCMNKRELIATIAESADCTKVAAARALDSVLANMARAMQRGERVTLSGFGSFRVVERAEQKGRNPQTGSALIIPAHNVVKFRPGKKLSAKFKLQ
jgi:DNA-binding protein HU-beta